MRHGPHQEAQKSTSTGTLLSRMISSNCSHIHLNRFRYRGKRSLARTTFSRIGEMSRWNAIRLTARRTISNSGHSNLPCSIDGLNNLKAWDELKVTHVESGDIEAKL